MLYLLSFCLNSCETAPSADPVLFSQNALTIDYHILVGAPLDEAQKNLVQNIIDAVFAEIDRVYNKWNPHSELSHLNAMPAFSTQRLSPQLHRLFQRLDEWVNLSEGRFDPTVEPLQQLWISRLEEGRCPTPIEIAELKPCIGWRTLHFEGGIFYKEDDRTQLDLGGVAKGLAVDLLVERLHQAGFNDLFVEWGGEVRALGLHPTKRPWQVGIRSPQHPDAKTAIARLDLINGALATSGDYWQYWNLVTETGALKTYCHIFNPLTLAPLEVKPERLASASLYAPDCATADALAKVLMLFDSLEEAQLWLERLQTTYPKLAAWVVRHQPAGSLCGDEEAARVKEGTE